MHIILHTLKYDNLKVFKMENGHPEVPKRYILNQRLGRWVSCQRQEYKFRMEGKPSAMSEGRIGGFNELRFT